MKNDDLMISELPAGSESNAEIRPWERCKLLWLAAGWTTTIRRLLRDGKALRPQHLD